MFFDPSSMDTLKNLTLEKHVEINCVVAILNYYSIQKVISKKSFYFKIKTQNDKLLFDSLLFFLRNGLVDCSSHVLPRVNYLPWKEDINYG